MGLDALRNGSSHHSADKRILGEVLEIPSAQNASVNVERRSEPQIDSEFSHLRADNVAAHTHKIHVETLSERRRDRDRRSILFEDLRSLLRRACSDHKALCQFRHQLYHAFRDRRADRMLAFPVYIVFCGYSHACRSVSHRDPAYSPVFIESAALACSARNRRAGVTDHTCDAAFRIKCSGIEICEILVLKILKSRVRIRYIRPVCDDLSLHIFDIEFVYR